MDEFEIEAVAEPELTDPVLVEGLPGVGHVGKLAAEHLVEERDGRLVRRVYSTHLPPQVSVDEGLTQLACAEVHAVETDGQDLLVLTGDHQAQDTVGHYGLVIMQDRARTLGGQIRIQNRVEGGVEVMLAFVPKNRNLITTQTSTA
mgnify:CR=1 FL=1